MTETSITQVNETLNQGNESTIEINNATFSYCLLEAQNWEGFDVSASNCSSDSNSSLCTDTAASNRIVSFRLILLRALHRPDCHAQGKSIQ